MEEVGNQAADTAGRTLGVLLMGVHADWRNSHTVDDYYLRWQRRVRHLAEKHSRVDDSVDHLRVPAVRVDYHRRAGGDGIAGASVDAGCRGSIAGYRLAVHGVPAPSGVHCD